MKQTQKLTLSYILALSLIGLFVAASQFFLQYTLTHQEEDSRLINFAGRQRMLSQKIAKLCLLLAYQPQNTHRETLRKNLKLWVESNQQLQKHKQNSVQLARLYEDLAPHFEAMHYHAQEVMHDAPTKQASLEQVLREEILVLDYAHQITNQLDGEAYRRLQNARRLGWVLMATTLILLVLAGLLIFRPTVRKVEIFLRRIKKQKNELAYQEAQLRENFEELQAAQVLLKEQKDTLEINTWELQERNSEIITQNEELQQTQEELLAQREFIEKQRNELLRQNSEIKNSLRAAELIQQAILPPPQKAGLLLSEYFVIYRPKDIVSGDFWWLNRVQERLFVVTLDCTGHGVAGAFMTMITNSLLDKIVRVRGIYEPAQILKTLHEEILLVLRQTETGNNYGMDLSLVCITEAQAGKRVTFAGAKQSIYYIEAGEQAICEVKGTRKAIGGIQNPLIAFEQTTFDLPAGSWLYMGTDGLADQNNERRKRLGEQAIKTCLLQRHVLPAAAQKERIEALLEAHMNQSEQRDDMLWLGFRL